MLYFVMIDIINDEQLTFVFEFFHCETGLRPRHVQVVLSDEI